MEKLVFVWFRPFRGRYSWRRRGVRIVDAKDAQKKMRRLTLKVSKIKLGNFLVKFNKFCLFYIV